MAAVHEPVDNEAGEIGTAGAGDGVAAAAEVWRGGDEDRE